MSDEILCHDCLDTGWIHDREGRTVCSCIAETEPYQQLIAEVEALKADAERYRWLRKGLRLEYLADQIKDGEIEDADPLDKAIDALRGEGE